MTSIRFIPDLERGSPAAISGTHLEVNELFDGPFRTIIEVRLRDSAVLKKHKADVPITILCLAGSGKFLAGRDLEDSQDLVAGTLITLDAGVQHEARAESELHPIVTKFKGN
ncbi:MAG: hypothetical protein ABI878_14515 [Acidobacteriota bacterium]